VINTLSKKRRPPKLPQLLSRKIYKTGQTRGADDDVIYQNRVSRNSTVLIPYQLWDSMSMPPDGSSEFDRGFIALISPDDYFHSQDIESELLARGLVLGGNLLVFYKTRAQWNTNPPTVLGWNAANSRSNPLGGEYVARVAATTGDGGAKINEGFNTTSMKGAGIRLYEYATKQMIKDCRFQLEAIFWLCYDSLAIVQDFGMSLEEASGRRDFCFEECEKRGFMDMGKLLAVRIVNEAGETICPLCLERISSLGFFKKITQAEGREVHDLTITQLNLFHIQELQYGVYNHRPYNLGWGHHHCNVVVKDAGINETVIWMHKVVNQNILAGYFDPLNKAI
jgi:BstXI restriction endonuclease